MKGNLWRFIVALLVVASMGLMSALETVQAEPVRWYLEGVEFDDGGTAEGWFTYAPDSFDDVPREITVSGGDEAIFPARSYTMENSSRRKTFSSGEGQVAFGFEVKDSDRSLNFALGELPQDCSTLRVEIPAPEEYSAELSTGFTFDPNRRIVSGSLVTEGPLRCNPGRFSGLWFDPEVDGTGINVIAGDGAAVFIFYGYSESGERLWLISETYTGDFGLGFDNRIVVDMRRGGEGTFLSPAPPSELEAWGTLRLEFYGEDTGFAQLRGEDGTLDLEMVRLLGIEGR